MRWSVHGTQEAQDALGSVSASTSAMQAILQLCVPCV